MRLIIIHSDFRLRVLVQVCVSDADDEILMRLLIKFLSRVSGSSVVTPATPVAAAIAAVNNHTHANFTRTLSSASPLNTYHNSLRKLKNGERMILFRNNSLRRSFKKINNESSYYQQHPHHCTIELKTKASSCLHLFNRTPPVILTTFRNQDDDQRNNELLWRYQHDISKTKTSHSQCNLNNIRHCNYNQAIINANNMITTETKFNNSLENKTIL